METSGSVTIPAKPLGPPSAPTAPLEVRPKTMSSIEVNWKQSQDDGGSEILAYQVRTLKTDYDCMFI